MQTKVLVVVDVGLSVKVYSDSQDIEVKLLQTPIVEGRSNQELQAKLIESRLPGAWNQIYKSGKSIGFLAIPRTKALVVYDSKGGLDVYSDAGHLDIEFFQTPLVEGDRSEIAIEQFIEVSLPTYWARIYRQGKRIALFTLKPISILDAFRNQLAIAFCRAIEADSKHGKRGAA
jgi:hypothetical protein